MDSKEQVPAKQETRKTKKASLPLSLLNSSNSKEEKEVPAAKKTKVVKVKELVNSNKEESSDKTEESDVRKGAGSSQHKGLARPL